MAARSSKADKGAPDEGGTAGQPAGRPMGRRPAAKKVRLPRSRNQGASASEAGGTRYLTTATRLTSDRPACDSRSQYIPGGVQPHSTLSGPTAGFGRAPSSASVSATGTSTQVSALNCSTPDSSQPSR